MNEDEVNENEQEQENPIGEDTADASTNPTTDEFVSDSLTFEHDLQDYKIKVFMWDSINGMVPLCGAASR